MLLNGRRLLGFAQYALRSEPFRFANTARFFVLQYSPYWRFDMNKKLLTLLSLMICCYACDNESSSSTETGSCPENQVLAQNGICYDNPECASCITDQVCVGGVCYDTQDDCAKCKTEQVCKNNICYDADDPCLKCTSEQSCQSGKCIDKTVECSPECKKTQYCKDGKCYDCEIPCIDKCCEDGEMCTDSGTCAPKQINKCDEGWTECGKTCCSPDMQ